jgi:hypothetical protein
LLHHKIGVISPLIYERIATGFLVLTFGLHALLLSRSTQQLESSLWWEFHSRMGGTPRIRRFAKTLLLLLLYGFTTLFTVILCSTLFAPRPISHWIFFSLASMGTGYSLAKWGRRSAFFSSSPSKIPSTPLGALVWGLSRPIFLPHGRWKIGTLFLLGMGNGYLVYANFPSFVCVLYTFLLALLPIGSLTQQLSRNLAYRGLETQHGISEDTYLQALYLCTGGLGLLGGLICGLGWWIGMFFSDHQSSLWMATVLLGVYLAPLWVSEQTHIAFPYFSTGWALLCKRPLCYTMGMDRISPSISLWDP